MATTTYNIHFTPNPFGTGTYIQYKLSGASSWTVPTSPANPTTLSTYPLVLTQGQIYYIATSSVGIPNCTANQHIDRIIVSLVTTSSTTTTTTTRLTTTTSTTTSTTSSTTSTTSSTTTTTTTGVPIVVTSITGLATPLEIYYNSNDHLMYYVDFDTITNAGSITDGAIGYFNPTSATTISDITYPVSTRGFMLEHGKFDVTTNKIFVQGRKSNGLKIFDCTTKTVLSTITYGTNSASYQGRQIVYIFSGIVYAGWTDISGFVTVNASSNVQGANFIPQNSSSYPSFRLQQIGSQMWVFETNAISAQSKVIIYNVSDLTTVVQTITGINTATDYNSRYTISDIYYDAPNNKIWYAGFGDKNIYAIDTITKAIVATVAVPMEGKNYAFITPIFNVQSDTLYFTGGLLNSSSDTALNRTYQINRATGAILATFNNSYGNFVYSPPISHTYATSAGLASYNSPNTGFDTDGSLIIYN